MKKLGIIFTLVTSLTLTACGYEQIPPAHKGKILDTSGFKPDVLEPSREWIGWKERLVLIETGTKTIKEPLTVLLDDRLEVGFDVRGRVRIDGSDKVINAMFNDITFEPGQNTLTTATVYLTYGQMLIRDKARNVLSKYTVDDVHKNRTQITTELQTVLYEAFKAIPLTLSDVALGEVKFPKVVTDAVAVQKERQLEIETERNKVKIELEKKKGQEQVAQADYRIKMMEAKRIRDYNKMIADGITPELLKLRALEVQEELAKRKGNNDTTVFMPYNAMESAGAQVRMFQK